MTPQEVAARLRAMFPELPGDAIEFLVSKLMRRPEQLWKRQYPHANCQATISGRYTRSSLTIVGDTMSVTVESCETLTVISLN